MKVIVDQDACVGDGICEDICPEVFELRDDGLAYVLIEEPSEDLIEKVQEAAEQCPALAIELE